MLLAWAVLLALVQMLVAVAGATRQVGLPALAGNREGIAPCTGWAGRAARAHHNMLESLLGAQIFFWARLASIVGLALIFFQVVA